MDTMYLALLRGINVGGNNRILMADLKVSFEQLGFDRVVTFIQSGNVLFSTPERSAARLTSRIEAALSDRFHYECRIVVISNQQLAHAVHHAPKGFGTRPDAFRYDVMFLRPPLTPAAALKQTPARAGVDHVVAGKDVLYFSRLIANISKSWLPKMVALPIYKELTVRNWNTTTKLLELMERQSRER